ncbi:acyl-CoA carboxylase subunit beta [Corynebacterium tapiri]|uniref:Acyl-CoA carboxylase subunit beta n=1 Tax=Corynebacterium tapiri TaxID=1448266 RepID=A0A5C4U4F3_9CORY|nr:carboxyl transferase domain-containing protein [Corynebacterium tapiri]TNL98441.1 acyl-CoA carboxylase subunit beta [Corynebacterium tapiri]
MSEAKPDLKTTSGKLADLRARIAESLDAGNSEAAEGLTPRQRIEALVDPGSFIETDALARHRVTINKMDRNRPATDGVVTGYGTIDGRRVCLYAHDESIFDGALGEVFGEKIAKMYALATKTGVPIISIHASHGVRDVEGVAALSTYAGLFKAASAASGLVPQIAIVAGETSGLAAVAPHLADIIIQVSGTTLHLDDAPNQPSAEQATPAHLVQEDIASALACARQLVSYLPTNNHAEAPRTAGENPVDADLDTFMPDDVAQGYDAADVVKQLIDTDSFLELHPEHAPHILTGFARVDSRAIGVVATNPQHDLGAVTPEAATKAAGFLRLCDAFNLPVIFVVDSPGFAHGDARSARAAAQLVHAFAESTVGLVTVVTRRAHGSAYALLGAKAAGADLVFAWPTAEIATPGAEADLLTPYQAAEHGLVDAVIEPSRTRHHLVEGLRMLDRKMVPTLPKKHSNLPL